MAGRKIKILFITLHRKMRSPGQRFRFEQYIDYLVQNGFECTHSPLLTAADDKIFYGRGNILGKARVLIKTFFRRLKDLRRCREFDIIFIYRDAWLLGTTWFERQLKKRSGARLVYDFDDSIWIMDISEGNKRFAFLKNPDKTGKIISLCDRVFAGNEYLANYARQFCSDVHIIPTTIDTEWYKPADRSFDDGQICIGWTGSTTTIKHFNYSTDALKEVMAKYGDKVRIKVIGDSSYVNEELSIKGLPWKAETEVEDLLDVDIGIMPLPDDEWAKGKCGLKGLQYMALEIPTIMSPVGVNTEIIEDGVDGFLASGTDEWVEKLCLLIEDPGIRSRLGKAGRKTVHSRYSVNAQSARYLDLLSELANRSK